MFPQENEYKSLIPKNAHGSPNFDKAACTSTGMGPAGEIRGHFHVQRTSMLNACFFFP